MSDTVGMAEAYKQYLIQKGVLLQRIYGLYEQVLEAVQSEREEEMTNLLETVNDLQRQVDDLDDKNNSIRSYFTQSEGAGFPETACRPGDNIHALRESNLEVIRKLQDIVGQIKTLAAEKKDESGRQLKRLNEGKKANDAYSGGPQLIEGVFIDFKK